MSSRRPPLPRPPRRPAPANLLYDCSMLPDDETVFLLPTNHDRRFSAHQYEAPPDQIPQSSYALDESVILNPQRRRIGGGWRWGEAIGKHIEDRVVPVGGEDEDGLCVVCQDDLCEENGGMARLDCGHQYHVNCINKWLHLRNTCPLCNATVILLQ